MSDELIVELMELLKDIRPEHYSEPEGLSSCDALRSDNRLPCDCGADEINAKIDAMLAKLYGLRHAR